MGMSPNIPGPPSICVKYIGLFKVWKFFETEWCIHTRQRNYVSLALATKATFVRKRRRSNPIQSCVKMTSRLTNWAETVEVGTYMRTLPWNLPCCGKHPCLCAKATVAYSQALGKFASTGWESLIGPHILPCLKPFLWGLVQVDAWHHQSGV